MLKTMIRPQWKRFLGFCLSRRLHKNEILFGELQENLRLSSTHCDYKQRYLSLHRNIESEVYFGAENEDRSKPLKISTLFLCSLLGFFFRGNF
jgi:hypothetical protein